MFKLHIIINNYILSFSIVIILIHDKKWRDHGKQLSGCPYQGIMLCIAYAYQLWKINNHFNLVLPAILEDNKKYSLWLVSKHLDGVKWPNSGQFTLNLWVLLLLSICQWHYWLFSGWFIALLIVYILYTLLWLFISFISYLSCLYGVIFYVVA